MGGLNTPLLDLARRLLGHRFAGYHVADERVRDWASTPRTRSTCPAGNGVQIELPPGLRGIGDLGEHGGPCQEEVITEVVAVLVELAQRAAELVRPTLASH